MKLPYVRKPPSANSLSCSEIGLGRTDLHKVRVANIDFHLVNFAPLEHLEKTIMQTRNMENCPWSVIDLQS